MRRETTFQLRSDGGIRWTCLKCDRIHNAISVKFLGDLKETYIKSLAWEKLGTGNLYLDENEKLNLDQQAIEFSDANNSLIGLNLKILVEALKQVPDDIRTAVTKRWLVNVDEKVSE